MDIAIVINTQAKNADALNPYLEALAKENIHYQLHQVPPEQLAGTIQACVSRYAILLIGGGDGSIRTAAQYCVHTNTILGVLPLGTLNHFAKELALPATAEAIAKALLQRNILTIDTACVNDHIFVNNSSIGFYPKFAKRREYYTKFYHKWLSYLPSLWKTLKHHESYAVSIKNHALNRSFKTSFLMISNNLYSYQFPLSLERTSFQGACLGIYFFKLGKLRLFKIIRALFYGKKGFEIHQTNKPIEIHLTDKKNILVSLDGDAVTLETPLHYQSLPKSLKLLDNS